MIKVEPLNGYLVIELEKENQKESGVLLPDSLRKENMYHGKVINSENGNLIDDTVIFDKLLLLNVKIGDEEVYFIKESDILGIIENG